jgi:hypothetical protein
VVHSWKWHAHPGHDITPSSQMNAKSLPPGFEKFSPYLDVKFRLMN